MEGSESTQAPWAKPEFTPQPETTSTVAGQSPGDAHAAATPDAFAQRPELYVGAAFAGGVVVAGVLRWLGR